MKLYKSKKIIKAEPMTLAEYAEFREKYKNQENIYGRIAAVPTNHAPDTPGQLVVYPGKDGKSFNSETMPFGAGYISWAPDFIFEPAHEEIKDNLLADENGMKWYKSKEDGTFIKAKSMTAEEYSRTKDNYGSGEKEIVTNENDFAPDYDLKTEGFILDVPGEKGSYISWYESAFFESQYTGLTMEDVQFLERTLEDGNKENIINSLLERNFTYHRPKNNEQVKVYEQIKKDTRDYLRKILWVLPKKTRETSLFCTKIDEAVMWANASFARYSYDVERKGE